MAENNQAAEAPKVKKMTTESIVKSQAGYTGKEHSDLVTVKIIADGDYYKKGDTDVVHPSLAMILKEKGLIEGEGTPYERPKFDQKDVTVDA